MGTLNKFQENGVTYFQLYIPCPACYEQGRDTPRSFWKHGDNECYGDVYVGDNAHLKCTKCGHSAHLKYCGYACPSHSNSPDSFVSFRGGLTTSLLDPSSFSSMVLECGQQWLMNFCANFGEW